MSGVEYERVVGVTTYPGSADVLTQHALDDYGRIKAACFPRWDGEPTTFAEPEALGRYRYVGWRARVPVRYVALRPQPLGPEPPPPGPEPHCPTCGAPTDDDGEWIGDGW